MNKRISPRKHLKTRIIFENENGQEFMQFDSANISTSGIFIQTTLTLKPQTNVFLKFYIPTAKSPIQVTATVMRNMKQTRGPGRKKNVISGMGLKFSGLSRRDFEKIDEFVTPCQHRISS